MGVNLSSVPNIEPETEVETFNDDIAEKFGTGGTASILYETKDANANHLIIGLPDGGETDVPVLAIGDQSIIDKDTALFNGTTVPTVAVFDASEAHYLKIDGSGTIASDTTITFSPSGQAATLTMTADGTVTSLIPASGDYLRIGDAGTTSHSFAANDDLLVTGKLEVDGETYTDGSLYMLGASYWNTFLIAYGTSSAICARSGEGNYISLQALDTGAALVEVARIAGAADPYFQIGRDDTGVATAAVTDMLVLKAGAGTNNEAAGFGLGVAFNLGNAASEVEKRASINAVLATATDGSEDVNFVFNLMDGGVAPAAVLTLTGADKSATFAGVVKSAANVGTANTGVTAVEYGDGRTHTTVLTVSQVDALTFADNAALADGYLLYTLPAGACVIESAYMSMAVTAAEDTTATADVGLGTVEGSGAIATLDLGAGGTMENIITGQTAANCSGTATVKTAIPTANVPLIIAAGDAHTVYFNVADTWADTAGTDLTADIAGTVVIAWRFLA